MFIYDPFNLEKVNEIKFWNENIFYYCEATCICHLKCDSLFSYSE